MLKILLVDDEIEILQSLKEAFEDLGHKAQVVSRSKDAFSVMSAWMPDVVLTDLYLQDGTGLDVIRMARKYFPEVISVVMTAQGSVTTAIKAMKLGAYDYLSKPFSLEELESLANKLTTVRDLKLENARLKDRIDLLTLPDTIHTRNGKMRKVMATAQKVAQTDSTILISGESGTGKTLLAKLIHDGSKRSRSPFAVVNCATLSENLLESELFGHVRGSFTGAVRDKAGRFEAAEGGTVFLDEIGEISPSLQTKLLRFLQDHEFERVGSTKTVNSDIRVVAATNKDLEAEVKNGKFREDLYFRLNVIELRMPGLRERKEDLPLLIDKLLRQSFEQLGRELKPLSAEAHRALLEYDWPGNIRELKNALERAAILCASSEVGVEDLPDRLRGEEIQNELSLEQLEKLHIQRTLGQSATLEQAADTLGIDLSTLWRKRKQYGFDESGRPVDPEEVKELISEFNES